MKSNHNFVNGIIPYSELKNFIEPITLTIPIPLIDLKSIGGNKKEEFYKKYKDILSNILKCMPKLNDSLKDYINNIAILSYTPHKEGYDFRINPINFINSVLITLGTKNEKIPFFNLDDENSRKAFKEYAKRTINKVKENNLNRIEELEELSNNIDFIDSLYDTDIEKDIRVNNFILAKDALLYLSYSSLLEYSKTNKKEYLRIPYEYYNYVGHMKTSAFPHKIRVGYSNYLWFEDFNTYYECAAGKDYIPVFNEFSLENNTLLCGWEILKSGDKEETFKEASDAIKRSRNRQNDERNLKMFRMKTNFYQSSPFKTMIKGRFGLNGYIGFVYNNNYIVYDKFYNNDDLPSNKKTILSHPEAIYSIPSDLIVVTSYDKQKLAEIKKQDARIVKNNHTITGSFLTKIDSIIKGPDVSTKPFEEVVKEDNKLLILR